MNRYKVFLRSGTVLTVEATEYFVNGETLLFSNGSKIIAHFAAGKWEGFQDVTPKAAPVKGEKSGS